MRRPTTSRRSPSCGGTSTTRFRRRPHEGPADESKELGEIREIIESEIAFVAEDDGTPVGFALARRRAPGFGTLTDLYVGRDARRSGIATELMREVLGAFR